MIHMKKLFSVTEVAKLAGVSRQRIHQAIDEGKIKPTMRHEVMFFFSEEVVKTMLKKYYSKEPV
jgi:predicted site-specific integrase-resolvase